MSDRIPEVEKAVGADSNSAERLSEKSGAVVELAEEHPEIDRAIEKRILRKFDLWILPLLVVLQLCS